jgi:hypothetical protein
VIRKFTFLEIKYNTVVAQVTQEVRTGGPVRAVVKRLATTFAHLHAPPPSL